MLGYRVNEIKPEFNSWRKLAHPDDWATMFSALQSHIKGETPIYECEHRVLHKDGHWVWILDRGQVVERTSHGMAVRMVGTHMDVSTRKLAEMTVQRMTTKLQHDEERSRDFSLSASDWFWETDEQHCFCYFSDNFKSVYGLPPERLLGRSRQAILELDALNSPESIAAHLAELKAQQSFKNFEYQVRSESGEIRWVCVSGVPHTDAASKFAGYRGTGTIVTKRKLNEKALHQAMQMAQAANLSKSRFLATMSHEIRTPMNGILGMAQLLLRPNLQDSERRDYASTILSSGQTLMMLLNDILDLSKIEAGKFQLDSIVFGANTLIAEIQSLFAGAAHAKHLQLDYQCQCQGSQSYQADAHRLRQMLSNLVGNAIKFTPQGQVLIECNEIEHNEHTALLEFSVRDSGIGIAADKLELLFKPFSQADSSTTREFGGSGLGLSIVHNLAQAMGGKVGVESTLGQGSRFWFQLRVKLVTGTDTSVSTDARPSALPPVELEAALLQGHVLVVEDNPVNCMVIESLLAQFGVKVTVVNDGKEAVDSITPGHDFDVILMDLQMPVMDGYTAAQRIRQWEVAQHQPRTPIIALTADAFEEDRQRSLAAGMDDFLTKPIAIAALRSSLMPWLMTTPAPPTA
jgi:PAS domain S-box-containing protein